MLPFRLPQPPPRSIVELIRQGVLDAELAALLWLLVEGRVPLLVAAGPSGTGKTTLLEALLAFLPAGTERRQVLGMLEQFEWLPEAERLGWRRDAVDPLSAFRAGASVRLGDAAGAVGPAAAGPRIRVNPATTCLVVAELSAHTPFYTWADAARVVVRAVALGYQLAATIHAESLEEVLEELAEPPNDLTGDELSRLGVVAILRIDRTGQRRITAVHYVRPVSRDAGGHVQRLGPAVLATWDPRGDRFEHFAWGIGPELAERIGMRAGDLGPELARRAEYLAGLAAAGIDGVDAVRTAIDGYRTGTASHPA
jgi:hypothetical protein